MSEPTSRGRGKTQRLPPEDLPEERPSGGVRRTERLSASGEEWSQREPVNPGWRNERAATGRRSARRGALPSSPQEFQLWLQAGGWRYLVGIAALLIVLVIALLALAERRPTAGLPTVGETQPDTSQPVLGAATAGALPTVTVAPAAPAVQRFFVVTGTGALGLRLRPEPNTSLPEVATLPDGTRVEQIGDDVTGGDFVWRRVRAPNGQEGFVAVEFLTPAP